MFTAGARVENISSVMEGQFAVTNGNPILLNNITRNRSFMIFGGGLEYHITPQSEFYSNIKIRKILKLKFINQKNIKFKLDINIKHALLEFFN